MNTALLSLPSAIPIKGGKGHWNLLYLPAPLLLQGRSQIQIPHGSWAPPLQNTPLKYTGSHPMGAWVGNKANTLLGRYTSQQGHTGRENLANTGVGPTHICSGTYHVRPRHPIMTHLNDSGKTGTGHSPDEAELNTRPHHTLGRGQAGAGGGLGSRPGCRDGGSGRQAGRAGASCSSQHNRRLLL